MTTLDLILVIVFFLILVPTIPILLNKLSIKNVFFTQVPEGEIIAVMHSGKLKRFIANIDGFWVHPKTGQVFSEKDTPKPEKFLPKDLFNTGIYWLGVWPFVTRYTYDFHWNKWAKKDDKGKDSLEYSIVPRKERVSSLYFRAQYPVQASGCETEEGVPLTMTVLVTTETVNADIALFKIKTPGWLSSLSGQVAAVIRDWNGKSTVLNIAKLQAELPSVEVEKRKLPDDKALKSEFQKAFLKLNENDVGNPSIKEMYGQEIVAVSFISYSIDDPTNDLQKASIKKYEAERQKEVIITEAEARNAAAAQDAEATKKIADGEAYKKTVSGKAEAEVIVMKGKAEAEAIALKGDAEAEASRKMTDAVKDNPHAGVIAIARGIEKQQHATTLIIGKGVLPTKNI